jgi:hypothetical protein
VDLDLAPTPQNNNFLLAYLQDCFLRIKDLFSRIPRVQSGSSTFVGQTTITTEFTTVTSAVATIADLPSANACFVRAVPVGSSAPSQFYIFVYTNAFALSGTSVKVSWIATGV